MAAKEASKPKKKRSKNGRAPNTLYTYQYGGLSLAHLGDLAYVPSQSQIENLGPVDVAMVPVGGGGALSPAEAAEVIRMIEPSAVIPMHYKAGTEKVKLLKINKFLSEMGAGKQEALETLKITKGGLADQTQVFVLSPAA